MSSYPAPGAWRPWLDTHATVVTRTPTALHVGDAALDLDALADPHRGWAALALGTGEAPPPLAAQVFPESAATATREEWAAVVAHLLDLAGEAP